MKWKRGEWKQGIYYLFPFISFNLSVKEINKIDNVKNKFQPYAHFKRFASGMGDFSSTELHIDICGGEMELVMDTVNIIRYEQHSRLSRILDLNRISKMKWNRKFLRFLESLQCWMKRISNLGFSDTWTDQKSWHSTVRIQNVPNFREMK